MFVSKTKRYLLFCLAVILETLISFSFFKTLCFPLLLPLLIFCEVIFYLELSNVIVLMVLAAVIDFLMADIVGRYLCVISIFTLTTLMFRTRMMPITPKKLFVLYLLLYMNAHVLASGFFVLRGYGVFDLSFFGLSILSTALMVPPTLFLYAQSLKKRVFVEGRYVKR